MADLCHIERAEGQRRIAELLDRFDLVEAARKPAATYSGGMRRRLVLIGLVGFRWSMRLYERGPAPP